MAYNIDIINQLTLYPIVTPLSSFANRTEPDQAALVKMADQGLLCFLMEIGLDNFMILH